MNLTDQQKRICEQVINVFESGKAEGNYAALVIYSDGPHRVRQVTYGRSQTTEYGNLEKLIELYVKNQGVYSAQLRPYLPKIGVTPLIDDANFKQLLRDAGKKDPIMRQTQDEFFDIRYFNPAKEWAEKNGFTLALSMLVIYDSFVHSGSILPFLRKRFPESIPSKGGNEKVWIEQYVNVRKDWLATHSNAILQKTVYRMVIIKAEIAKGNWDLTTLPIEANGIDVMGI